MFGRKKKIKEKLVKSESIQVIPEDFYGGKDPVVHFDTVSANKKGGSKRDQKNYNKRSLSGGIFGFFKNKLFIYIILGFIFLSAVAGISWYYLDQAGFFPEKVVPVENVEKKDAVVDQPIVEEVLVETGETEDEVLEDVDASLPIEENEGEIESPVSLEEQKINFPRIIQIDSTDTDADSLTDIEEEIFDTDSGAWDTDGDGFYDGEEMVNLYNPRGTAPVKLIDSGLVQEYVNPKRQYRVYYPIAWENGLVDEEGRQVLFSSITGDFIEILVFDLKL